MLNLMTLMSLVVTAMFIKSAIGASHVVGGPNGKWDQVTDLATWAKDETFEVGDTIDFTYSAQHNVLEVNEKDYDACDASNPITTYSDGDSETKITLSSTGKRFFICGASGHCAQGMKVTIDTVSSSTPSTPMTPAKSPPKSTPSANSPPPVSQDTPFEPPPADSPPKTKPPPNAGNGGYEVNFAMVLGFGLMTLLCL
ncbi:hypothetical protein MKX01_014064 [Papaver californicum]|nr:hypothetical protein MKX01_014064 [Papaver californicum]